MGEYPPDIFDGVEVAPTVLSEDRTVGDHQGSVYVQAGAAVTVRGMLQGSLTIEPDARAVITGRQQGSVTVGRLAQVQVVARGRIEGSLINHGAVAIEEGAALRGSLINHGRVIVRGELAGQVSVEGDLVFEGRGRVVPPTRREGNTWIYEHRD